MWYQVDFFRLVVLLTPKLLRKSTHISWLKVLVCPLQFLYEKWSLWRADNLYRLNHNSQVCYLTGALNDYFDKELRRIQIQDAASYTPRYVYTQVEKKPVFLGTLYLRDTLEYDLTNDFIVWVPSELNKKDIVIQIRALIDYFRLAGMKYDIRFKN